MEAKKRTITCIVTIVALAFVAGITLQLTGHWEQNKWFVIGSAIIFPWYPIFKHHVIREH